MESRSRGGGDPYVHGPIGNGLSAIEMGIMFHRVTIYDFLEPKIVW